MSRSLIGNQEDGFSKWVTLQRKLRVFRELLLLQWYGLPRLKNSKRFKSTYRFIQKWCPLDTAKEGLF